MSLDRYISGTPESAAEADEAKLIDLSARVGPMTPVLAAEPHDDGREVQRKQARLLDLEIAHFIEKHRMAIRQGGLRRFSDRLKIATQAFAVLSAMAVAVALGSMVVAAIRSQAVVVDSFDSPPALAERGLTGTVVAGRVLDSLTTLKAATFTAAARRKTTNAWSQDIKVQVPQTAISLGEIDRLLRARLGRDTHIGGDLVQEPDGRLSLTVRGDGILPRTFTGPASDLEKLTTGAAEYIYGTSEPVLFAMYLSQSGRLEESLAFMAKNYQNVREAERPDMLNVWGLTLGMSGKPAEAIARFRQAVQINPRTWKAWANLTGHLEAAEGAEAAYQAGMAMLAEAKRAPAGEKMPLRYTANFYNYVQDWNGMVAAYEEDGADGVAGRTTLDLNGPLIAVAQANLHDWAEVERALLASDPDNARTKLFKLELGAMLAMERGDHGRALALAQASTDQFGPSCRLGQAYLGLRRFKEAAAAFAQVGEMEANCLSDRADLLEAMGDWPATQAAHAKAIAFAPSLPLGYHNRGLAQMRHGDLAGAEASFAIAHRQGPRWADPLKSHGDALAARGRWAEAIAKYAQAEPLAPQWEELHRSWAAALKASGDGKGAAAHLQRADEIRKQAPQTLGGAV